MTGKKNGGATRFLFLGGPLLDVTARCERDVLERYGLRPDDCVRESAGQHVTLFRSLLDDPDTRTSAGGSAQNSARIAKWILGEAGSVTFAGCVGRDVSAARMRHRLLSEGVESLYVPLEGAATGLCVCLLSPGGERSMCARLGAAEHFSRRHLSQVDGVRRSADCVFVEGYYLAQAPDVVIALANNRSHENQVFAISLSAEYVCREHAQTFLHILPEVDVVLSNESEARTLATSMGIGHLSVEEIASVLAKRDRPPNHRRPRIVVVTRGPKPVLMARGNDDPPLKVFVPRGVKVTDSVGCGDALAGAFLAKYVSTGDHVDALKTGVAAAVQIAQVPGCNPPKKALSRDDLARLLTSDVMEVHRDQGFQIKKCVISQTV